jgi:hypothetical protein
VSDDLATGEVLTTDEVLATGPARCPLDDWVFEPRYTDGLCPLCGWRPPGGLVRPPRSARIDWFWPAVVVALIASVVMGVLVLVAYNSV